jgi:hypothetical protein
LLINLAVFHTTSLAKYAVDYFRISHSGFILTFSARSRDAYICSCVIGLAPAPVSLHAVVNFTQLRGVCATRQNCLADRPINFPSFTCLTVYSLNSVVYSCFGIFSTFFLQKVTLIVRHPWKTIYRGNLTPISLDSNRIDRR